MKIYLNLVFLLCLCTSLAASPTHYIPALKINGAVVANGASISAIATNAIQFELDYTGSGLTAGPLKVFYEFGDGNYSTQFNPQHIYASSFAGTSVEVRVHTIDDYDDEEEEEEENYPPPQTYRYTINFSSSFTNNVTHTPSGNSGLLLWQSWDIVADQEIHYVATDYDCSAPNNETTAQFEFDSDYFTDSISVTIGQTTSTLTATLQGNGMYIASTTFKGLSVDSTNLLFNLFTKDPLGREPTGCVKLTLLDSSGNVCNVANLCGRAGKSHDPNMKEVLNLVNACDGSSDIEITYQIHYQNIGNGEAEFVTVEDYLDDVSNIKSIEFINSKHRVTSADPVSMTSPISFGPLDYLRWHFIYNASTGQVLRGTQETGMHYSFSEEDTKGWIQFKVVYAANSIADCNAMLNRARIIFDCNEFINTKNAYAWEECENDKCPRCIHRRDHSGKTKEPGGFQVQAGSQLVSTALPTNITSVNWYPDQGLGKANPQNPKANPVENTNYAGVYVDQNCNRYIYHVQVNIPQQTNNAFQVHKIGTDLVLIGGAPPYSWSNSHTGSTYPLASLTGSVTITDNHGCKVTYNSTPDGDDPILLSTPILLLISAVIFIGIFLFLRFRSKS